MRAILLSTVVFVGLLSASESALRVDLPDVAASRERFAASPYGRALLGPELAELRRGILNDGPLADDDMDILLDVLRTATALTLAFETLEDADPSLRLEGPADLLDRLVAAGGPASLRREEGSLLIGEPPAVATSAADLRVSWHPQGLLAPLPEQARDVAAALLAPGQIELSLTSAGLRWQADWQGPALALQAVDAEVLAQLPGTALMTVALGMDLSTWFDAHGELALQAVAALHGLEAAELEAHLSDLLDMLEIDDGLPGLARALGGTWTLSLGTDSGILPDLLLSMPAHPQWDRLLIQALAQIEQVAPQVGGMVLIDMPIPQMPQLLALGRSADRWWLGTDALQVEAQAQGQGGGFLASPAGAALAARLDGQPCLVMATDTRRIMRSLLPLLVVLGNLPEDGRHALALADALVHLVRAADIDLSLARQVDGGLRLEGEGLLLGGPWANPTLVPLLAAIGLPNVFESRGSAEEMAAIATLRGGILAGQFTFQAGVYNDLNGNNLGEYGFLPQLSGRAASFGTTGHDGLAAGNLEILGPEFAGPGAVIRGYHFTVYLPDADGIPIDWVEAQRRLAAGVTPLGPEAERAFIAYAWPADPASGQRVFALNQEGWLAGLPVDLVELPPAWNAALRPEASTAADLDMLFWPPAR